MLVLITYDVSAETADSGKPLRTVDKACKDYGQRVHRVPRRSCSVDQAKARLTSTIRPKSGSPHFYFSGDNW